MRTNVELSNFLDSLNHNSFSQIDNTKLNSENWFFSNKEVSEILNKIKKQPRQLSNIVDGIYQGIVSNGDDIFILEGRFEDSHFYGYSKKVKKTVKLEKSIVKPILKGEDIGRYTKPNHKNYVIYPHITDEFGKTWPMEESYLKINFPLTYEYLFQFKKELLNKKIKYKTNKKYWYSLHRSREISMFEKIKILTPDIASDCLMTIDEKGTYHTTTVYSLVFKETCNEALKYLLTILNSKLMWFFLVTTGSVLSGNFFRFKTNYLISFPILKELSPDEQEPFIFFVDQILAIIKDTDYLDNPQKQARVKEFEAEIDQLVYKLYDLTPEEIKIVGGESKNAD